MVQSDLGSVLFNQGEIDAAIKHFKAAVASDPKSILARMNLAEGFAARGKIDEALAQYRGVMALDPDNQVAREECDKLLRRISEPSSL
jgi:Tfp pilus assembly protein PilF